MRTTATWCFLIWRCSMISACSTVSGAGTAGMAANGIIPSVLKLLFACVQLAKEGHGLTYESHAYSEVHQLLDQPAPNSAGGDGARRFRRKGCGGHGEVLGIPDVVDVGSHSDIRGLQTARTATVD